MGVASIRTFFIQRMKDLAPIHHGEVEQETKIMQPQFVHHKEIEKKMLDGWVEERGCLS